MHYIIVHFISIIIIIIISAPSQIMAGNPCPRVFSSQLSARRECNLRHSDK